jgi:hypothetical protein
MSKRIVHKPIDQVPVGTLLAQDIKDSRGSMILAAGQPLSERILQRLKTVEVQTVAITEEVDELELAEKCRQIEASLDRLFRHWSGDPVMDRLKTILATYRKRAGT